MVQVRTATGSLPSNRRRIATRMANQVPMPAPAQAPNGMAASPEETPSPLA
jgi:hypothetical protein